MNLIVVKPVIFLKKLENVELQSLESLTASFTCEVSIPQEGITVQWLRCEKSIKESVKYKMSFDGSTATLIILNCDASDEGEYRVKINDLESSASLLIKGQ